MTQRQLADLSTVSVRAIRDLESGRASRPRTDTVRLIADGLGLRGAARLELESAARAEPRAGGLPVPLGLMLGRDTERAELRALLASGTQRLVTLTGLAGVGKTRLAVDVAAQLRDADGFDAVWGADLGAVRAGPTVLVLDGADEHTPLDEVIALLHHRGQLRVLCTARAPLGVPGERAIPLGPLAVPTGTDSHPLGVPAGTDRHPFTVPSGTDRRPLAVPPGSDPRTLARVPAVALLLHHVAQVQPGFRLTEANSAAVAGIVGWLGGVPALLEAAAGWFLVYPPDELLSYLHCDPVGFATGRLAEWRDAVWRTVAGLDATDHVVLSLLTELTAPGPVPELAARAGLGLVACAAALGRLVLLGLVAVTHGGAAGRFHVLEPVRTVCANTPEGTAAVLPLRLPVSTARAS
jgi:transcriptional regulator with XRE-family HTH domain